MTTGPLVTPPALAVMLAVPESGLPEAFLPLQLIKLESHTPAQIKALVMPVWPFAPGGVTVAMPVFDELKVMVVVTAPLVEFSGFAVTVATSPAFSEIAVGV